MFGIIIYVDGNFWNLSLRQQSWVLTARLHEAISEKKSFVFNFFVMYGLFCCSHSLSSFSRCVIQYVFFFPLKKNLIILTTESIGIDGMERFTETHVFNPMRVQLINQYTSKWINEHWTCSRKHIIAWNWVYYYAKLIRHMFIRSSTAFPCSIWILSSDIGTHRAFVRQQCQSRSRHLRATSHEHVWRCSISRRSTPCCMAPWSVHCIFPFPFPADPPHLTGSLH